MQDQQTVWRIMVVDDDPMLVKLVEHWLTSEGHEVVGVNTGEDALDGLSQTMVEAVVLDLQMPGIGGLETLVRIRERYPRLPVLILTRTTAVDDVVGVMQQGAFDYLTKPVERSKLMTSVRNAVDKSRLTLRVAQLERAQGGQGFDGMVGKSAAMRDLFFAMERVASTDVTVLVHGESGTGKELVAQALHAHSARHEGPFVAVNCAAIATELQESEMFGHERGAFTGATKRRLGRFEQASGGTLFLDEVGELSLTLQAKLLRALQERRFFRVGGEHEISVDVRVVAATHRDLHEAAANGEFRQDLYYRLAVFELEVPALRERAGDIDLLIDYLLAQLCDVHSRDALPISDEARACLGAFPWPGNVRELRNTLERAIVLANDDGVQVKHFPRRLRDAVTSDGALAAPAAALGTVSPAGASQAASGPSSMSDIERTAIEEAMAAHNGNVSAVCRELGIGRTTLYRRLRAYGLR